MLFPESESFEAIAPYIFRISASSGDQVAHGTACVIGRIHKTGQLILATARHVLVPPDVGLVTWRISQYNAEGDEIRGLSFTTSQEGDSATPFKWHKKRDIGVVTVPDEPFEGAPLPELYSSVTLINPKKGVMDGTSIAWAGFPWSVEDYLGFPQVCFFSGTVSAMVNTKDRHLYIADGHVAQGVSGAPVWFLSQPHKPPEVVGIVSSYTHAEDNLPGFCVFEPINPLVYYLGNWHTTLPGGYDNFVVMQHGVREEDAT